MTEWCCVDQVVRDELEQHVLTSAFSSDVQISRELAEIHAAAEPPPAPARYVHNHAN